MTTIMIVDPQAIVRRPIESALRRAGYRTVSAANARHAMMMIAHRRPDLIVLDLTMRGMEGLAMLRTLRASREHKDLPVIVLASTAERWHVIEAAKLGITSYMLKSRFSLLRLLEQVRKHLEGETPQRARKARTPA